MEIAYIPVVIESRETVASRRKVPVTEKVTYVHEVPFNRYTEQEAPVVFRVLGDQYGNEPGELLKVKEYRGVNGRTYLPAGDRELGMQIYEADRSRFQCAIDAEQRYSQWILIGDEFWMQAGEPVYSYSSGFSRRAWVDCHSLDLSGDHQFYFRADELDLLMEHARSEGTEAICHIEIEVLDRSYVKSGTYSERKSHLLEDVRAQIRSYSKQIDETDDFDKLYELLRDLRKIADDLQTRTIRFPSMPAS